MKSVCFDVLGTCFEFTSVIELIESRFGNKLAAVNVDAKSLFFSFFYAAQRDFTYTSMAGRYTPIAQVLKLTFRRACMIVDLPPDQITDEDVDAVMEEMKRLRPRTGLKECFDGLREAGFDLYGVTNGGKQTSLGYYKLAGIDLDEDHLLSCDDISVAKPDHKVYTATNEHLTARGLGQANDGDRWFVAAHAWDLLAAKGAGFKTAYLEFEEHDPVEKLFGEHDIHAATFKDLLEELKKV